MHGVSMGQRLPVAGRAVCGHLHDVLTGKAKLVTRKQETIIGGSFRSPDNVFMLEMNTLLELKCFR